MASTGDETELTLRVDLGSDPIAGSLTTATGARHPFRGWIGMSAALERIRADEARGACTPRSPAARASSNAEHMS